MAIASFNFGSKSDLPSTTTIGALYFLTDSGELFYGNGSSGVKVSDIEIVDTFDDLSGITPLSNKFYYVTDEIAIYRYEDGDWHTLTGGGGGGSVNAGVGLAKSGSTIKAKLIDETALSASSASGAIVSGKVYSVNIDSSGYLCVAVPWDNTTYESKAAADGGTDLSLVTTGEKYNWNNKTSNTGTVTSVAPGDGLTGDTVTTSGTIKANLSSYTRSSLASGSVTSISGKQYPVHLDSSGYLSVNVPWDNTTYESKSAASGGTDLSLVTTGEKYDWNSKTSNTGTVTQVSAGDGLSGGPITGSGSLKANLTSYTKSSLSSASISSTANRQYAVGLDSSGYLSVNVPWDNTTYESKTAASGGTDLSLVTTGEKYNWNSKTSNTGTVTSVSAGDGLATASGSAITGSGTIKVNLRSSTKLTNDSAAATEVSGRVYPVAMDKTGYLAVNVPWDNTTYESKSAASGGTAVSLVTTGEKYTWNQKLDSAGTGLSKSGTTLNHSNSITAGTRSGSSGAIASGGSFNIPSITWDAQGHIISTSYTTCTIPTIPSAAGTWTSPTSSLAVGTTSCSISNPKSSTSITVDPYCQNSGTTVSGYTGTAPVAVTGIAVTSSYIYLSFPALTVATSFKCLVY